MGQPENKDSGETQQWLTTGDMARLSQTTLRTVRFYESEGLIASMDREEGNHRRFARTELLKLQAISDLREAGMSLQDIKTLIELKSGCTNPDSAVRALTGALSERIGALQQRIETLSRVRQELSSTLATIQPCAGCTNPSFPQACCACEKLGAEALSRPTHLLWKN